MSLIPKQTADAAAAWWMDALRRPKFDNGDDSDNGGLAMCLALIASTPDTEDKVAAFGKNLSEWLQQQDAREFGITLSTDYGPGYELSRIAEQSGFRGTFPWKTVMWVKPDSVKVKYGYGANIIDVPIK